jgi:hypothetical protein
VTWEYPDECPAFLVDSPGAKKIRDGAVVEGMGTVFEYEGHVAHIDDYLIVRAIDDDDILEDRKIVFNCLRRIGWFGLPHHIDALIPLTPAAKEMLAIARGK